MTTLHDTPLGRIFVPEISALTIGPAFPSGRRRSYAGVAMVVVRPGPGLHGDGSGGELQKSWGIASPSTEGLYQKWAESDGLQRLFDSPERFDRAVKERMFTGRVPAELVNQRNLQQYKTIWHNERGQYGGRLEAKLLYGFVSSPTNSGVAVPTYMCVNKTSTFTSGNFTWAKCGGSQSLSDGVANVGANVTTNEFTADGLTRAVATLSAYADSSALDGGYTGTIAKTFTDTTAPSTGYGIALADNTSGAFNLFAESPQTTFTLQISDTLAASFAITS